MKTLINFVRDDSGAVTVDWVVLAGAVVALAIGVVATVETGLETAAGNVETQLGAAVSSTIGGTDGDLDNIN